MTSQTKQIEDYLLSGGKITPLEALEKFNCFRLSGRIFEIRERHPILTEMVETNSGKRVARYSILS